MKQTATVIAVAATLLLLTSFTGKAKLIAPVRGRISSKFGKRGTGWHNGIDIAVPVGTSIKSPASGEILKIWTSERGGKQMLVLHDNGFISGYAHLNKWLHGKGKRVKKGQVIAESGKTGVLTGAHLHFTWKLDGEYKNPARYFKF